MTKLLTIIVPLYNRERLIIRALDSIPKRSDIEIIIVDDASTDNSLQLVNEWSKNNKQFKVILLHNQYNSGPGECKNIAYSLASAEYIYVLDSDDYILTDVFNDLLNNLKTIYSDYDIVRIKNRINTGEVDKKPHTAGWSYILKNRFKSVKYPKVRKAEDWLYWLELHKLDIKEIDTDIVCYHYNYPHEGSIVWEYEHGKIDWKGDPINAT